MPQFLVLADSEPITGVLMEAVVAGQRLTVSGDEALLLDAHPKTFQRLTPGWSGKSTQNRMVDYVRVEKDAAVLQGDTDGHASGN